MLGERGFRDRVRMHAWIGIGAMGLYCATVGARTIGRIEVMTALALAVMGIFGTWASFKAMGPTDSTAENMRGYLHAVWTAKRGVYEALGTMSVLVVALLLAAAVGKVDYAPSIGASDGLRTAALIGFLAYVWRLKARWRVAVLVVWATFDIIAAWRSLGFAETPMKGDAMFALAVGAPATLAVLIGMDIFDGWAAKRRKRA